MKVKNLFIRGRSIFYWNRLERKYMGMIAQGLAANLEIIKPKVGSSIKDEFVKMSVALSKALIEELQKEGK